MLSHLSDVGFNLFRASFETRHVAPHSPVVPDPLEADSEPVENEAMAFFLDPKPFAHVLLQGLRMTNLPQYLSLDSLPPWVDLVVEPDEQAACPNPIAAASSDVGTLLYLLNSAAHTL